MLKRLGVWSSGAAAAAVLTGLILLPAQPADPIIRDSIALSINDLAILTSSNTPAPDPVSTELNTDHLTASRAVVSIQLLTTTRQPSTRRTES